MGYKIYTILIVYETKTPHLERAILYSQHREAAEFGLAAKNEGIRYEVITEVTNIDESLPACVDRVWEGCRSVPERNTKRLENGVGPTKRRKNRQQLQQKLSATRVPACAW